MKGRAVTCVLGLAFALFAGTNSYAIGPSEFAVPSEQASGDAAADPMPGPRPWFRWAAQTAAGALTTLGGAAGLTALYCAMSFDKGYCVLSVAAFLPISGAVLAGPTVFGVGRLLDAEGALLATWLGGLVSASAIAAVWGLSILARAPGPMLIAMLSAPLVCPIGAILGFEFRHNPTDEWGMSTAVNILPLPSDDGVVASITIRF